MIRRKSKYRVEILRREILDKEVCSLKKEIRNVVLTCVFGGMVAMGIGGVMPEQVSAASYVTIDYGEYRGHIHHWWDVDINSIRHNGNETTVEVGLDNANDEEEERTYHFKYSGDYWLYMYDTWTGKGDFIKGRSWNRVSSDRLANDVLYIVNNN